MYSLCLHLFIPYLDPYVGGLIIYFQTELAMKPISQGFWLHSYRTKATMGEPSCLKYNLVVNVVNFLLWYLMWPCEVTIIGELLYLYKRKMKRCTFYVGVMASLRWPWEEMSWLNPNGREIYHLGHLRTIWKGRWYFDHPIFAYNNF